MSSFDSYRKQSAADAKAILDNGVPTLEALASALASMPYTGPDALGAAETAFASVDVFTVDVNKPNAVVDSTYTTVRNSLASAAENIRVLERFVGLHVPQMEVSDLGLIHASTQPLVANVLDGNNFGVTVQMMFAKLLKDERDKLEKSLTDTSKYYASRADAIDKFTHLPKISTTETKSSSQSNATGGKDGDENKTSTSTATEEKIARSDHGEANLHRVKALAALDAQMYMDLVAALQSMRNGYIVILDNLEKNWTKLEEPRGKGYGGYGSGGRSMAF
ncbi:hypothetical protein ACHAWU_006146 [Discostella pseudostelligera]|uniref:Proteasome activator PA28 C-terminal domain-containing protein n=1 Tax=Discostella pseudostelligera TaxID=259834 RepID=A0ABD3M4P6_9STRA